MKKIYVASSWKNTNQPFVVDYLKIKGHEVYDFRHPTLDNNGFYWNDISKRWEDWSFDEFKKALKSDTAKDGYKFDKDALDWCECCVLLLNSGRSSHLEAGYVKGAGKLLYILIPNFDTPELMYKMADGIYQNVKQLPL